MNSNALKIPAEIPPHDRYFILNTTIYIRIYLAVAVARVCVECLRASNLQKKNNFMQSSTDVYARESRVGLNGMIDMV